jgi:hypothetical protein
VGKKRSSLGLGINKKITSGLLFFFFKNRMPSISIFIIRPPEITDGYVSVIQDSFITSKVAFFAAFLQNELKILIIWRNADLF